MEKRGGEEKKAHFSVKLLTVILEQRAPGEHARSATTELVPVPEIL